MAFRKRKLINNWESRDLDLKLEDSDSRIVLERGEDFNKLLSSGTIYGVVGSSASDYASDAHAAANLQIDWAALSQTLECVPLHTRLGLDSSCFTKEALSGFEEEALRQRAKLGLKEPKTEASASEAAKTPCQTAPTQENAPHGADTSSAAETVEQLSLELDELLSSGPGATGDRKANQKYASSVEYERRGGESRTEGDSGQGEFCGGPGQRDEEADDAELDALLGLSQGEGGGGTGSSGHPAASGTGSSETAGELENWLEGVLD